MSPFSSHEEAHAAMEQARMQAALQVHTFNEMLDGMTAEQLQAMSAIFEGCMRRKSVAPQIYGQITAILRLRHSTCQCGQDHSAEFDVDTAIAKMTEASKCDCDASWSGGEHAPSCMKPNTGK